VFIYIPEAHPGENVPHHDSFERKLACARLLAGEAGIGRDIRVDDLDGTVHRAYGLMPNMTWVIGRGGRVPYDLGSNRASHSGSSALTTRACNTRSASTGTCASSCFPFQALCGLGFDCFGELV
jgi:hypothetical protein